MKTIFITAKYLGAYLSGGLTALFGAIGASTLGQPGANTLNNLLEYTIFNPDRGYFKDFPDRREEKAFKRIWRVWHD